MKTIATHNREQGSSGVWIIVAIVVIGIIIAIVALGGKGDGQGPDQPNATSTAVNTADWKTYTNTEFQFTIQYPPSWQVAAFTPTSTNATGSQFVASPTINIYKPNQTPPPPYTHHAAVTQVSIFPEGVPTEGLSGQGTTSTVQMAAKENQKIDFVLGDGTVWATYINFENPPATWEPFGFVFSSVPINGLEIICQRSGTQIDSNQCDPLTGDILIRQGSVNAQERAIEEAILKSFQFSSASSSTQKE